MDNAYGTAALLIILILLLNVGFNMLVKSIYSEGPIRGEK